MDTPTKPSEANPFAEHFRAMAERIERIDPKEFGGAFLYVPPDGSTPIAFVVADPSKDKEAFLAAVSGKIAVAQQEMAMSKSGGYPRR